MTEEFWGPQVYGDDPIRFDGTIIAGEAHIIGAGTILRHDPDLNTNPMVTLTRPGLRAVQKTTRQL